MKIIKFTLSVAVPCDKKAPDAAKVAELLRERGDECGLVDCGIEIQPEEEAK